MHQTIEKGLSRFTDCKVLKEGKHFTLYFDPSIRDVKPYLVVYKEHGTVATDGSNIITAMMEYDTMEACMEALSRVADEGKVEPGNRLQ